MGGFLRRQETEEAYERCNWHEKKRKHAITRSNENPRDKQPAGNGADEQRNRGRATCVEFCDWTEKNKTSRRKSSR